ncbi:MAG: hypothetical protein JXA96_06350 [Sedimentisphaerales bacterium]|nr:hypothetical protein [Sedimentisphaerales bacterium]
MLVLCANQWFVYTHNDMQNDGYSIVDVFQNSGNIVIESDQERVSPLVSQAGEFALIIDQPKPPKVVKKIEPPQPKVIPSPPDNAPRLSAKFKLLSTSYNRDRPEDSVALIDEPGKGEHWAKVGDFIGNFILEPGTIIYRYGNSFDPQETLRSTQRLSTGDRQANEMAVEINQPVRIAQERKSTI